MTKRLSDYDKFQQGIPINRKMADLETGRLHVVGVQYITREEFIQLQVDLENRLAEQTTLLASAIDELRLIKTHLASMSDAVVEPGDGEE